jgi:F-type H+-transporting ATPase subunit c
LEPRCIIIDGVRHCERLTIHCFYFFKEISTVNRLVQIGALCLAVVLLPAAAFAQTTAPLINLSGSFGAGLVVIGAAFGIGRLAAAALESMARQPEVAGSIQTAMIIAAALIEGFTFYALFICSQSA